MSSPSRKRAELIRALTERMRLLSDVDVLFSQALADRLGLNLTDFKTSSILDQTGPVTAGRLAELTGLTTGAITGVLDRLEKAGYARRVKNPADRRHVIVEAVHTDEARIHELLGGLLQGMGRVCEGFTDAELSRIAEFVAQSSELLRGETVKLRASADPSDAGPDSAPLAGRTHAKLRFTSGAAKLQLVAGAPAGLLYRVKSSSGRAPRVKLHDEVVTIQAPRFSLLDLGGAGLEVALAKEVRWEIELSGGMSKVHADLHGLELAGLEVRGGASAVEIALPQPEGVVPVRIRGGASRVSLTRPRGAAMRVRLRGGAAKVSFEDKVITSGGHTAIESPGAAQATDVYELEIHGGASHVSID